MRVFLSVLLRVFLISGWTLLLLCSGCGGGSGGTTNPHPELLGTRSFTIERWAAADQVARGEMVASFLALYPPAGMTRRELTALLGRPTGYYEDAENLAYVVGPTTIKSPYADGYLLVFVVDQVSGRVARVIFVPDLNA